MCDSGQVADPLEGVSSAGMIVTGTSRARVATKYEPTLDAACDGMADLDPGASLYLYGSVAMAGLVSITDETWTTDRRRAAQRWSHLQPEWAGEVMLLTDWSGGGSTPSATEVPLVLDGVIAAVVEQFGELIGLWGEP